VSQEILFSFVNLNVKARALAADSSQIIAETHFISC